MSVRNIQTINTTVKMIFNFLIIDTSKLYITIIIAYSLPAYEPATEQLKATYNHLESWYRTVGVRDNNGRTKTMHRY